MIQLGFRPARYAVLIACTASGCAGDDASTTADETGADESSSAADETETSGAEDTTAGDGDGDTGVMEMVEGVTLPQAVRDAFYVDTSVYSEIPIHVLIEGVALEVTVTVDGTDYPAEDPDLDGDWVAVVPVAGGGTSQVTASAGDMEATAELGRGTSGLQFTVQAVDGAAVTPLVHRRDDAMYLTWSDRKGSASRALLQEIDGLGRRVGNEIMLVPDAVGVSRVRTAFGERNIGVMYQVVDNSPYSNWITIVDFDGNEVMAPQKLIADPWGGSAGGGIEWTGDRFVMAFRRNDGVSEDGVDFFSVDENGMNTVGPVEVMTGSVTADEKTRIAHVGDVSYITTARAVDNAILGVPVDKGLMAAVDDSGAVLGVDAPATESDFFWTDELHVFNVGPDKALGLWLFTDLTDPDPNPSMSIHGYWLDETTGNGLSLGNGTPIVVEPDQRWQPFVLEHPTEHALMLWLDLRDYQTTGYSELYVAPLDEEMNLGTPFHFNHPRFFLGAHYLNGTNVHTNVMMVWSDLRGGQFYSEIYLDTVWY